MDTAKRTPRQKPFASQISTCNAVFDSRRIFCQKIGLVKIVKKTVHEVANFIPNSAIDCQNFGLLNHFDAKTRCRLTHDALCGSLRGRMMLS